MQGWFNIIMSISAIDRLKKPYDLFQDRGNVLQIQHYHDKNRILNK